MTTAPTESSSLPGYIGVYRGKRAEVHAPTILAAQLQLAKMLGVRKHWEVAVALVEIDGKPIVHVATE